MPGKLRHVLAFLLGEHVHVAVAVVTHVLVIQGGQWAGGERRAEVLVEPVGHHDLAVRIGARHQQEDHVVENLLHRRGVVGREAVDQLQRHLRGADFVCMNAARDEHDDFAGPEDLVALARARRAALEIQFALELLVPIQILQRVW